MGRKVGGGLLCPLFGRRSRVPIYRNVVWAEAYLPTKWHLDPSSRLDTTDMGRKLGVVSLWEGELRLHLTQCGQGRQVLSWSIQPFSHNTPTSQTDRQTDRQGRQNIQTDSIGEPFYNCPPKDNDFRGIMHSSVYSVNQKGTTIMLPVTSPSRFSKNLSTTDLLVNLQWNHH